LPAHPTALSAIAAARAAIQILSIGALSNAPG
jgi:hypothetical protein